MTTPISNGAETRPRSRAQNDRLIIVVCSLVVFLHAHFTHGPERLAAWLIGQQSRFLDEMLETLMFLGLALLVYSYRRGVELQAAVAERQRAQEALAVLNDNLEARVQQRTAELTASNERLLAETAQRDRAEARLLLLRSALEATANAVVITDMDGTIEWVNPAYTKLTGYPLAEAVGHNSRELVKSGRQDAAFYEELWATLRQGKVWRGEMVSRRKDGSLFTEEAWFTPVKSAQGEVTHHIGIKQDITARKELEAHAQRAQRMDSIGTLAGGIAHDLNNALGPVLMSTGLLKLILTDPNPEVGRILDSIHASAQRGADMVKQILTFARGTEGALGVVQPKHLVREIIGLMRHTFTSAIQLRNDLATDLWPVLGNATQLHQILLNLCVNARDAMPAGGTLTVAGSNVVLDETRAAAMPGAKAGSYVLLSVTDTGTGMPPEVLARIFEPFYTTKEPGKGTGLGLATVRHLVQEHAGFLNVETQVGRGTTFQVYLPAHTGDGVAGEPVAAAALPMGSGELILVVDNEAAMRNIIQQTLEAHGYKVLVAVDGAQAVALCAEHRAEVRLMLTDMAMPYMDGRATTRAVRTLRPELPVILASGTNYGAHDAFRKETGAQAFLSKPFSMVDLVRTVHEMLDKG